MHLTEISRKSVIVAAHPDDEILWFSSILEKVDEVVLCFLYRQFNRNWKNPNITMGRQQALSEFPIRHTSCLYLTESEVFSNDHWYNPTVTRYGIEISRKGVAQDQYIRNYHVLKTKLSEKLKGYRNVFTHNPWGEYGNEEHIQVYRVIKELQQDMNFDLWYSNYCSNKSFNLMQRYVSGYNAKYITLKTNKSLAHRIKNLYMKNKCWSWYDDWEWLDEESIIKDDMFEVRNNSHGHTFPLNMIKIEFSKELKIIYRIFRKLAIKIAGVNKGDLGKLDRTRVVAQPREPIGK